MEVLHILAKHLTKLAENLFVPRVIFQVHFGLDLLLAKQAHTHSVKTECCGVNRTTILKDKNDGHYLSIVNDRRSKLFPGLCIVKGSPSFANLDKQGLPLGEIFTKPIVDVLSLHVPQALVLQPHLGAGIKD